MKKLLLLVLLFAVPQAFALFRTTGLTPQQIEQEKKAAEEAQSPFLSLSNPQFQEIISQIETIFPASKTALEKLKSSDIGGKLLTIVGQLQDVIKSSFQNLSPAIQKIQKLSTEITIADLNGLINQLNGYAAGRLTGINLKGALADVFNKVKDTYKKLVESDNQIISISEGKYNSDVFGKSTGETKLADAFLQALVFNIVQGKASDELLPLITHSLELKSKALTLQPAKGNPTAGEIEIDY